MKSRINKFNTHISTRRTKYVKWQSFLGNRVVNANQNEQVCGMKDIA